MVRDTNPAGAVLVELALPVPEELHLHPSVLVHVDRVVGGSGADQGAHDHRRLGPASDGLGRAVKRPPAHGERDGLHVALQVEVVASARLIARRGIDVGRGHQQVVGVQVGLGMGGHAQLVAAARGESAALAEVLAGLGPLGVQPQLGEPLGLVWQLAGLDDRRLGVAADAGRMVVLGRAGAHAVARGLLEREVALAGHKEVVLAEVQPRAGRRQAFGPAPQIDLTGRALRGVVQEVDPGHPGAGLVRLRTVAQHHHVPGVLVAEEIVDPFLFHEAGGEGEVGLAELHAVLANGVVAGEAARIEVVETGPGEHFCQDVLDRLVLEDADIGPFGQGGQPWTDHQLIVRRVLGVLVPLDAEQQPMERAGHARRTTRLDGDRLVQRLAEIDRPVSGDVGQDQERLAEPRRGREAVQHDGVPAQAGLNGRQPPGLTAVARHRPSSPTRLRPRGAYPKSQPSLAVRRLGVAAPAPAGPHSPLACR